MVTLILGLRKYYVVDETRDTSRIDDHSKLTLKYLIFLFFSTLVSLYPFENISNFIFISVFVFGTKN